jgi:hypothetical protein
VLTPATVATYGVPVTETYEQYEPAGQATSEARAGAAAEQWCVIIEYSNRGDAKPPTRLDVRPDRFGTRKDATAEAARLAFEYQPPDPMSPQGRQVYEVADGYLVVIRGAMSTFHINVRPARVVGEAAE